MSGSIGGVDASIPLQAGRGVEAPNPLQQIGQFANVMNALNTGELQKQAITRGKSQTAQTVNQIAAQGMLPLLDLNEPLTIKHLVDRGAALERAGLPVGGFLAAAAGVPITNNPAATDRALRMFLASGSQADPGAALSAALGRPAEQNAGQQLLSGRVDPLTGRFRAAGATELYPSRDALSGRTTIGYDPVTGAAVSGPLAAVTPPSLAGGASMLGNGRFPPALLNPNRPGGASPPAGAPGSAMAVPGAVASPGPAVGTAQSTTGTTSANAFDDIRKKGVSARTQDALLANMENDIEQFTSGSGAGRVLDVKKAAAYWAPSLAKALGVDENSIAAQENFNKVAAQIADAQGAGSDARLAVNQSANPNQTVTPAGIRMILKQLRGNSDYLKAYSQTAAAYPNKEDAQGFEAKIGGRLNPQVFQFARLSPSERTQFYRNIKDDAVRQKFQADFRWAKENGFVDGR